LLAALIRRQAQTARHHLHGRGETLVERRRTIIGRREAFVERGGTIFQGGETLLERRVRARRRGRVGEHGSPIGGGIGQTAPRLRGRPPEAPAPPPLSPPPPPPA